MLVRCQRHHSLEREVHHAKDAVHRGQLDGLVVREELFRLVAEPDLHRR